MTTPRVTVPVEQEFAHYRRSQIAHLRPYAAGETLSDRVSISSSDLEAGSPKPGDMIARNPANHDDQWLVAADYFAANFEPLSAAPAPEGGAVRYRHKNRGTEYTLIGVGRAQGELQDDDPVVLYRGDDGGLWARHQVEFCDGRFEQVSALATREEAPAEDDARRKLIQCIEQWDGETEYDADDLTSLADSILHAFNGPPVVLRADPVQLSSNPCQLEAPAEGAGEFRQALENVLNTSGARGTYKAMQYVDAVEQAEALLRAQPQAREDAQPVGIVDGLIGRLNTAELDDGTPLYTHPAPDALRVAVESLEWAIAEIKGDTRYASEDQREAALEKAQSTLAALQAEQGAK